MSVCMFGITNKKLSQAEVERNDKACKAEGDYGYTQIQESNGQYRGWFSGPNHGSPFDADLAARVLNRIALEEKKGE